MHTVIVKQGAKGSLVWSHGVAYEIEALMVKAIDTTGAGDAYAGGFLWGLAQGWPVENCGKLGSAVAAATVSQMGAVVKDKDKLASAVRACAPKT